MSFISDRQHQKLLIQIVIGAAWADGHLEPREIAYLQKLLHRYGLDGNEDLTALLTIPVTLEQTVQWMRVYGRETTEVERHRAVVAIANLLIADDEVVAVEHELLDEFHQLMGKIPAQPDLSASHKAQPEHHDWLQSVGSWVKQTIGQFKDS